MPTITTRMFDQPPRRRVRHGSSTQRYDAAAHANVSTSASSLAPDVSSPMVQRSTTSTGQCHRYNEYEMRPIATTGVAENTRPTQPSAWRCNNANNATVPSTGHRPSLHGEWPGRAFHKPLPMLARANSNSTARSGAGTPMPAANRLRPSRPRSNVIS